MPRKSQKRTRYRRNREFGDIHGGRVHRRFADNIFKRVHSLTPPDPNQDELPVFICDNSSRDFFFPITPQDVLNGMQRLPNKDTDSITHVWFRRLKRSDYETGRHPLATFSCGSGVRLITFYPWPKDLQLRLGNRKPVESTLRWYSPWTTDLEETDHGWVLRWTMGKLRAFYLNNLLLHEIGHHVDWFHRRWSRANLKQVEAEAERYAFHWSTDAPKGFEIEPKDNHNQSD